MKAIVIGAGGKIGRELMKALSKAGFVAFGTTRNELDLLALPEFLPAPLLCADVAYLCAAVTRFIDCEDDRISYRVNVDAPMELGKKLNFQGTKIIYLSSEAVERGLHTNYGMHKALAEIGLRAVCDPVIARLARVDSWSMVSVCDFLVSLAAARPGVYRWDARYKVNPVYLNEVAN